MNHRTTSTRKLLLLATTAALALHSLACNKLPSADLPNKASKSAPDQGEVKKTVEVETAVAEEQAKPQPDENELIEITFDDLNIQIQADIVLRPWMLSDRVKELDGKRVRISGYMLPGEKLEDISQLVLLRNTECKFGPGGQADHLVSATMREDETTVYNNRPIQIDGTLKISPYQGPDGNTWSIYELNDVSNVVVLRR